MSNRVLVCGLLVVTAAALSGCAGRDASFLLDGEYAGSTAAKKAVVVDVGSDVLLDGERMKLRPDRSWVAADEPGTTMQCRMAAKDTEMVCRITRDGHTETVDLLRL